MKKIFLARPGQELKTHLLSVAQFSQNFLPEIGAIAYYIGLFHDLGKARQEWQDYLNIPKDQRKKIIPHAIQGAIAILHLLKNSNSSITTRVIAMCIRSHHGSLKFVNYSEGDVNWQECYENCKDFMSDIAVLPDIQITDNKKILQIYFQSKMLFSALVDADRWDAQNFLQSLPENDSGTHQLVNILVYNPSSPSPLKDDFTNQVLERNRHPHKKLFTLTAPCGIGKTIASLKWACQLLQDHQLERIVYVGPLKSIIEQTAEIYRQVLPNIQVLEHHTGYDKTIEANELAYDLSCERWDSQVIVTTMVQFVDSLISPHSGKNRKLHHLRNTVVIIDEAQTLPENSLIYVILFLEYLAKFHNCYVLLMSATQPYYKNVQELKNIEFTEILPPEKIREYYQARQLYTVEFISQLETISIEYLCDQLAENNTAKLVVVNITTTAQKIYIEMSQRQPGQWVHLSSRMCVEHRKQVLARIKLQPSLNIISTQIVEAGVDISRDLVYSQLCPLDSLIQRGGRCNRFGNGPNGKLIIFEINKQLPEYKNKLKATRYVLANWDMATETITCVEKYFKKAFSSDTKQNDMGKELVQKIEGILRNCLFTTELPQSNYDFSFLLDNQYRAIPDHEYAVSAICLGYNDQVRELVAKWENQTIPQSVWLQFNPYIATIPKSWEPRIEPNGLIIWDGPYDPNYGASQIS